MSLSYRNRLKIFLTMFFLLSLSLACAVSDVPGISGGADNETSTEVEVDLDSSDGASTEEDNATIEELETEEPTAEDEPAAPTEEAEAAEEVEAEAVEEAAEDSSTPTEAPSGSADLAEDQIFILPGGTPPTMDPHLSGDATSAEYVVEIFSGLMAYDPDLNLIPDIAQDYTVSEDSLVYTFTIKEEAKFQDGKPIRAEDFKWSFERACDPATGSRTADTYLGDIIGCRDKLQGLVEAVEGVVVVDDLTLELTIDEPKGFFLAKMTYPTAYVLDQENVESSSTWFETPNGSGPFVLAEYAPDEGAIILDRNDNYYREPMPILERVIFLINAPLNLMTGYEEGLGSIGLDGFSYDTIPVGTSTLSAATDPNNPLSQEFVSTEELSVFYIGFNVNKPPFDDPLVRQALNLALDKERMVKLVFQGALPAANGIVPPTMPNYQNPDLSDFEFDPERALELIAESSYGDVTELPDITLNVSGTGGGVSALTEAVVESLKENLGLEVAVEQVDWPEFLEDLDTRPEMPYQMYQLGWVADYPDPQNFLEILFHSRSAQNHGQYNNPDVDVLLDEARGIQDIEERFAVYQEVEQLILEDAVWIPLYFSVESSLVKPYVQNFQNPPIKVPRFQYMSIAER